MGWYSRDWMFIDSTDCTVEQVIQAAQYSLTADSLLYDISDLVGISEQVAYFKLYRKCKKKIIIC